MDEAQVKALIEAAMAPAIRGAFQEFRGYFQEQLEPLSAKLNEFEVATAAAVEPEPKAKSKGSSQESPELTALTARLAQMEQKEQERQAELKTYKFGNELQSLVGKYDAIQGDLVKELLSNRYGSKVVEKNGKYYTPNGTTLDEEVDGFFKSEAGSHFIKAPTTSGSGTQKSNAAPSSNKAEPSVDDMLADMTW
jgi:hypothetical protein